MVSPSMTLACPVMSAVAEKARVPPVHMKATANTDTDQKNEIENVNIVRSLTLTTTWELLCGRSKFYDQLVENIT